jgi:hypothetical protein
MEYPPSQPLNEKVKGGYDFAGKQKAAHRSWIFSSALERLTES